jgi:aminoglycoside phosphotransferase family enzyme/predicted kinase
MNLPPLVAALLRPDIYPHRPSTVALEQTHISYVFLAGDHVYKVKKPVKLSFLDFSTLELRRHFCHEEVRLNRRLAADVYYGVIAVCEEHGTFRLGAEHDAAAADYAVHMRRLPEERLLNRLLDRNAVSPQMIALVARRLADFHHNAGAGPEVTANGDLAAIRWVLQDNFANARPFRERTLLAREDDHIQGFVNRFLAREEALFRKRQAEHRIRDCHGDLHADHLCFVNGVVIFDCIEFNPRFRFCDVASDLAFLAMDLDYHGHPELAAHLIDQYTAYAGDTELRQLVPFYKCYRAYVRGKVDSLKSVEPEVGDADREAARASAQRHFALAYRYSWADTRCLVIIAGLSGTGKSTVAATLAARTGFAHINSDVVRKTLPDVPPGELYSGETSARTYGTMFEHARAALAAGRSAIIDATFQRRCDREETHTLARRLGVPRLLVECRCSDTVVLERLDARAAEGRSVSDADRRVYEQQKRHYEPIAGQEADGCLVLDTSRPVLTSCAAVETAIEERTGTRGPW